MDKGIRPAMTAEFLKQIPNLPEWGYKKFRSEVTFAIKEAFGITQNAVSTHFNHAKNEWLKANPGQHIGRAPEKNNGGRKKKVTEVAEAVATLVGTTEAAATEAAADAATQEGEAAAATAETAAADEAAAETPAGDDTATAPEAAATLYTVTKVSDGTVVAASVTQEQAEALVAKAAAAKKSKLQYAEAV